MEIQSHQADVLGGGDSQTPGPDQVAPADPDQSEKGHDANSLMNCVQDGPEKIEQNALQPPDRDDTSNYAVAPQGVVPPSATYDYLSSEAETWRDTENQGRTNNFFFFN